MYILGIWGYSNVRDLKFITADTIARLKKKREKEAMLFHNGRHSFLQGAHFGNHCFNRCNNSICNKKKASVGTNRLVFGY